jgi:hypothetical protein
MLDCTARYPCDALTQGIIRRLVDVQYDRRADYRKLRAENLKRTARSKHVVRTRVT